MRACIHRGAREIGGSCVELEADGQRLILDVGRPLSAEPEEPVRLPASVRIDDSDQTIAGVMITHGHPDHYGLVDQLGPQVPVYIGQAAARILDAASFFMPRTPEIRPQGFLVDRQRFRLGPFEITPFLVDHSAFDAHALLVEADGRRLLYTGDLRAHGRKPGTFERLISEPPAGVDVLLLEGTRLSRVGTGSDAAASEAEVEARCIEAFRETEAMVLACYSAQNIDRYVSIYRAAVQADRDLVIDLYTAACAAATGRDTIPQADWDRVRVFVPLAQRRKVKRTKEFDRVNRVRRSRLFPEQLAESGSRLVMTFRGSMAEEFERAGCLVGATAIWSMWPGYLEEGSGEQIKRFCARNDIPLTVIHSSGHATSTDLKRLAAAIDADRVVPIHTAVPESYAAAFGNAEPHRDGEWWEV